MIGEFLVLLGPSGCGKTTLLNLLAGLLDVTAGRISIGNRDVTDLDPKDRGLAMVFQSYALYPTKTVYGNLKFGLSAAKLDKAEVERRIAWAAKLLQIEPLLQPQAGAALGRAAPARRHRPGAGEECRRVPVRRAALQPRCEAAHRDAARDQEAARRAEEHHRLRHPRPDRGHDHGHQDRRDGWRRDPAVRHPRRDLFEAAEPLRRRLHRRPRHEPPAGQAGQQRRRTESRCRRAQPRPLPVPPSKRRRWTDSPSSSGCGPSTSASRASSFPTASSASSCRVQYTEKTGGDATGYLKLGDGLLSVRIDPEEIGGLKLGDRVKSRLPGGKTAPVRRPERAPAVANKASQADAARVVATCLRNTREAGSWQGAAARTGRLACFGRDVRPNPRARRGFRIGGLLWRAAPLKGERHMRIKTLAGPDGRAHHRHGPHGQCP